MTKRMLIDATHAEETRVVVLDGTRLEDFDVEAATKKQLKGNIYLAKVVRVEPSLQAAFVEYGGNRHGFLAFGEIHPDYYQIPVADRQRLIAQQEQEAREAEAAEDRAAQEEAAAERGHGRAERPEEGAPEMGEAEPVAVENDGWPVAEEPELETVAEPEPEPEPHPGSVPESVPESVVNEAAPAEPRDGPAMAMAIARDELFGEIEAGAPGLLEMDEVPESQLPHTALIETDDPAAALAEFGLTVAADGQITGDPEAMEDLAQSLSATPEEPSEPQTEAGDEAAPEPAAPETVGGDTESEDRDRRARSRMLRSYKIQEVIRRRQIMLVQVVKEERGGKGAALTTYISLAGRFCVLMPNSPRGGGISRKITSAADRRRLKEITAELEIPSGMGLIVRTAGAARPKPEIRRDCEYLLRLWDDIRDTTMRSVAPAAIHEEASLIKRAIRDVYSRDVDEVLVDGLAGWQAARDYMRMLMPSHARKVIQWHDPSGQPLFAYHQVDAQLDAMLSPTVPLRSGGYLVINQTEALVAIDVNSGRSTRERGIEETAVRTNCEAADEIGRQLRLRDLAGLIVIDFIDMEQRRNNAAVERRLKDALKNDRARIQLGSISAFGLMELSRQRLRPSLAETSFVQCPHCVGTGLVRSTEGAAVHVLRAIEEEGSKRKSAEVMVHVAPAIALYILNHKRERLREIEARYGMSVVFTPDVALLPPALRIEKLRLYGPGEGPALVDSPVAEEAVSTMVDEDDLELEEDTAEEAGDHEAETPGGRTRPGAAEAEAGGAEATRRRRRRRRRGGRREDGAGAGGEEAGPAEAGSDDVAEPAPVATASPDVEAAPAPEPVSGESEPNPAFEAGGDQAGAEGSGRRRGRRGGRRRRRDGSPEPEIDLAAPVEQPMPAYTGPTPANPFGGEAFDIFDVMEQAEAREASLAALPRPVSAPVEAVAAEAPVGPEPAAEMVAQEVAAPVRVPRARPSRSAAARAAAAAAAAQPELIEVAAPVPEASEPVAPEPVIKPILVDEAAPAAPKRGWWKR